MAKMGKSIKRIARKLLSSAEPCQYFAGGRKIVCPHCGGDIFDKGEAQLNTATMTFFNLDWANKSATTLVCIQCSRIQWFMEEPKQLS